MTTRDISLLQTARTTDIDVTTCVVSRWSELTALASEWDPLLEESPANTIFLRWQWITSWLAACRKKPRPFIITVRDGDARLLGVAPFYQHRYQLCGLLPVTVLRPLADTNTGAEYPDIICRKRDNGTVVRAIMDTLVSHKKQWDILWIPRMRSWRETCLQAEIVGSHSGLSVRERPHPFSVVHLPDDRDTFAQRLPRRKQRRHQRNRIMKHPDIHFTRCRKTTELDAYLDALFHLHQQRWRHAGRDGVFVRHPAEADFYRQFAAHALNRGWLACHALKQNDAFKAIQLGYIYQNTYHVMQEGFDPDFMSGCGGVLRWLVIDECIENGITSYDFLGEHTPHKASWQSSERQGSDLMIGHDRTLSRLIQKAGIWPTGRYLRARTETRPSRND